MFATRSTRIILVAASLVITSLIATNTWGHSRMRGLSEDELSRTLAPTRNAESILTSTAMKT